MHQGTGSAFHSPFHMNHTHVISINVIIVFKHGGAMHCGPYSSSQHIRASVPTMDHHMLKYLNRAELHSTLCIFQYPIFSCCRRLQLYALYGSFYMSNAPGFMPFPLFVFDGYPMHT